MQFETPTTFNPWVEIWFRPRTTIRHLVNNNPTYMVWPLALLAGISTALNNNIGATANSNSSANIILWIISSIIGGVIGGALSLVIGASIYRGVGSWYGGEGTSDEIRTAIAWAGLPSVVTLPLFIPTVLLFEGNLFQGTTFRFEQQPLLLLLYVPVIAISLLASIYQFVLSVVTLAEAHRFSVWRALATIVTPILLFGIPLFLCFSFLIFRS